MSSRRYDMLDGGTQNVVPITLKVNKLTYAVNKEPGEWWERVMAGQLPWIPRDKAGTTQILRGVSFTATSGQLMAIMGGSGSGKTSLLDVLACRNTSGTITGDVYLNSVVRTKEILDSCAGYVRQEDRLISFLSVRETLTFVARLKLPSRSSRVTVGERVDQVLAELGLTHVADTRVGDEAIRGLSGGERRRVSIGIQLLILPSVLFLDEPTSGLDSFTAHNLVQTLARLASRKRTVIMSIHQPRYDIFNIIDTVMILSKGKIVYNGQGSNMLSYFQTLGFPCPEHINPCDFYIDLATVDGTSREREEKTSKIVQDLHAAYEVQADAIELLGSNELITGEQFKRSADSGVFYCPPGVKGRNERETLQNMLDAFSKMRAGPGFFIQIWVLLKRFLRVTIDDYSLLLIHLTQATFMSFLLGTAYWELGSDYLSIRDWYGLMFLMSILYPYMVILGLIGVCHEERRILFYELQDKLYHPAAYYGARILNDVPFHLIYNIFYCLPVYAMANLEWDFYTFFLFYVYIALSVFTSRCLAMMVAAIFPSFRMACIFAQAVFTLLVMSAGFILNINNLMEEFAWVAKASYLRWGFQALSIIQIQDKTFSCPNITDCINGKDTMADFGFDEGELWICATGLFSTIAVFLIFMYVGLRYIPQRPVNF